MTPFSTPFIDKKTATNLLIIAVVTFITNRFSPGLVMEYQVPDRGHPSDGR